MTEKILRSSSLGQIRCTTGKGFCKGMEVVMPGSPPVVVQPVYFSSSGGWLAKCLVLAAAQFSLSPACAVT